MKTSELRELTADELAAHRRELKQETLNLRVQQQTQQLENPARLRAVRREIARIETLLSEKRSQQAAS